MAGRAGVRLCPANTPAAAPIVSLIGAAADAVPSAAAAATARSIPTTLEGTGRAAALLRRPSIDSLRPARGGPLLVDDAVLQPPTTSSSKNPSAGSGPGVP